jgi:hypothetical protein
MRRHPGMQKPADRGVPQGVSEHLLLRHVGRKPSLLD